MLECLPSLVTGPLLQFLFDVSTQPPLSVMEGLVKLCSEEKCFSRLAEVVKLARDRAVALDCSFYQQVSVSLRQWGQDQEALAELSRVLGVTEEGVEAVVASPRRPSSPASLVLNRGNKRSVW